MKKIHFFSFLLMTILVAQSCSKDPLLNPQDSVAPNLPANETFIMPFAGFESADTTDLSAGAMNSRGFNSYQNWFFSATNVVVWNAVLTINMIIPVSSFAEAFNHKASFQGNGIWLWAYSFNAGGKTLKAELTGQFLNEQEVQWDMFISETGGFSKVHWYSGVVSVDGSKGSWTLNHNPSNPTAYLKIDYSRNSTGGAASIRYTNIESTSPDQGDYIEYREVPGSTDFNRAYDVFRSAQNNLLQIQWNAPNKDGRVKNQQRFQDSEWHCWDENLVDTDC